MTHSFARDDRAQVATEYLLLLALGLVIVVVAITLALQLRNLSQVIDTRTGIERNNTIAILNR